MTFLWARRIAQEHGYHSCLLLPKDHVLYTQVENTHVLFSPLEVGSVICLSYADLLPMNEQAVLSSLQKVPRITRTGAKKKATALPTDSNH